MKHGMGECTESRTMQSNDIGQACAHRIMACEEKKIITTVARERRGKTAKEHENNWTRPCVKYPVSDVIHQNWSVSKTHNDNGKGKSTLWPTCNLRPTQLVATDCGSDRAHEGKNNHHHTVPRKHHLEDKTQLGSCSSDDLTNGKRQNPHPIHLHHHYCRLCN